MLLFVYGTLRSGSAPAQLASWLSPLERRIATVPGRLLDLGDYPGAVEAEGEGPRIVGELVAVPSERLPEIDRYEGFDPGDPAASLFVRARCQATLADGTPRSCWVYRYAGPPGGHREVPGGDWRAHPTGAGPG